MKRRLFHGMIHSRPAWDARHSDGRHADQVYGAVWETSKTRAAAVLGFTRYEADRMMGDGWPKAQEALATVGNGELCIRALYPGNTVARYDHEHWLRVGPGTRLEVIR